MVSDNATDKKIRLGEVASALDVAPKLIRNWVGGGRFDLLKDSERAEGKWREYSYLDVAHLSIASQIIRYGFTIDEAHDFAGATLVRLLGPLVRSSSASSMPGGVVESICTGRKLIITKFSDGDSAASICPPDPEPPYIGAVCIDLWLTVHLSFNALADMGHNAFSASDPKQYSTEEAEELRRSWRDYMAENAPEQLAESDAAAKTEQPA